MIIDGNVWKIITVIECMGRYNADYSTLYHCTMGDGTWLYNFVQTNTKASFVFLRLFMLISRMGTPPRALDSAA